MTTSAPHGPLVIPGLKAGLDFLAALSPSPPVIGQQISRLLDSLLHVPPPPDDFFRLLEQLNAPLYFAGESQARRYTNKALPLDADEEAVFNSVVTLWRKMLRAYSRCAQLGNNDVQNPHQAKRLATILHRCLHYTGQIILEHYRARREQPEGIWMELHGYFDTAQEWDVIKLPVEEVGGSAQTRTNCIAAYSTQLLLEIANPYGRSVRDLKLISLWANQWGMLVHIRKPQHDETLPAMVIDLMQDKPLYPGHEAGGRTASTRHLETSELVSQLEQSMHQLDQKQEPAALGLGDDAPAHIRDLLHQLLTPWSMKTIVRRFRRFPCAGTSHVAVGFEAMHYFISGQEFDPHHLQSITYSGTDPRQLETLHYHLERRQEAQHHAGKVALPASPRHESAEWEVLDQSATGFRLRAARPRQTIRHGQLLAILPHDGQLFLLCQAVWLMQENSGALVVGGITVLPGLPGSVGVRSIGVSSAAARTFIRAFFLPDMSGKQASLVLPLGYFRPSDLLEVVDAQEDGQARRWNVQMKAVLRRGTDFEHVLVEQISLPPRPVIR